MNILLPLMTAFTNMSITALLGHLEQIHAPILTSFYDYNSANVTCVIRSSCNIQALHFFHFATES